MRDDGPTVDGVLALQAKAWAEVERVHGAGIPVAERGARQEALHVAVSAYKKIKERVVELRGQQS